MAKIILCSGKESHTTSFGSVVARVNGKSITEVIRPAKTQWLSERGDKHKTAVLNEFEVADGTQIEVESKGADGPRGVNRYHTHQILRVDSSVEPVRIELPAGPFNEGYIAGRLVLVRDLVAGHEKANTISEADL